MRVKLTLYIQHEKFSIKVKTLSLGVPRIPLYISNTLACKHLPLFIRAPWKFYKFGVYIIIILFYITSLL